MNGVGQMRILIVEDDAISRMFLRSFFLKYGACDEAVDGLEALGLYVTAMKDEEPYQLICLDIMMPKVDGVRVLRAIRDLEKQNKIPHEQKVSVIMTSALDDKEYVKNAFELGCDAYISKPIDLQQLMKVMNDMGINQISS